MYEIVLCFAANAAVTMYVQVIHVHQYIAKYIYILQQYDVHTCCVVWL